MNKEQLIYIADDDRNIRQAIKTFLENEGYRVEDFETGDMVMEAFKKCPCDLMILDVMMPGTDGFEVCRQIREKSIVPTIMLTARDTDMDYATGMSLGSDDYFTKPFSVVALSMRVKAIFRRIEFESRRSRANEEDAHVLRLGTVTLSEALHRADIGKEALALTPNEYELLKYLLERSGQAVARAELLEKVWGYETDVETRATDDTVRRLRKKLEPSNVVIETVWGYGFRIREKEV